MKYVIDYSEVFETLGTPLAICDEDGRIQAMNAMAEALLEPAGDVRLILTVRETVRQMRMTPQHTHEFFLADVRVEGARKQHVSISLSEMSSGGYRVTFDPEPAGGLPTNVRLLQGLVNAHRHADLFGSADRVSALFAACFAEVLPECSFHLEFPAQHFVFQHHGWGTVARTRELHSETEGKLASEDLLWADARTGYRIGKLSGNPSVGILQVERQVEGKFTVSEREAFETFLQQTSLALGRLWQRDDFSKVSPIIDQLDSVVIVCDPRRHVRVTNRTFETLVGESAIGRDVLDFFDDVSRTRLRMAAASVMAGGEPEQFEARLELNGANIALLVQVAPNGVTRETGAASQGFIVTAAASEKSVADLTARMQHAEHLLNIGQLASGVAHELKNPLTAILNYADYLLRKYEDQFFEERDRERLRRIISGVEHIDGFIQDLLILARPEEDETEGVDLQNVLQESLMYCEATLTRYMADVKVEIEPSLRIVGSRTQLKQVFTNLITNAARALPEKGGAIHLRAHAEGDVVVCEVEDGGKGMSSETLKRIFEPFFTTRDGEGGTGLGLAIVDNIVRRHRGQIDVISRLGHGTTFTLRLMRFLEARSDG